MRPQLHPVLYMFQMRRRLAAPSPALREHGRRESRAGGEGGGSTSMGSGRLLPSIACHHGSAKVGMGPEVVGRGWDFGWNTNPQCRSMAFFAREGGSATKTAGQGGTRPGGRQGPPRTPSRRADKWDI